MRAGTSSMGAVSAAWFACAHSTSAAGGEKTHVSSVARRSADGYRSASRSHGQRGAAASTSSPLRPVPLRRGDRPGRHGQARGRQTTAAGREGPGPRLRQAPASRRPGPGTAGRARQGPAAPGPGSGPSAAARRRHAPDHGRAEARRRRTTPEEHPPDGEGARRHAVGRQAPRQASGGPRRGTPPAGALVRRRPSSASCVTPWATAAPAQEVSCIQGSAPLPALHVRYLHPHDAQRWPRVWAATEAADSQLHDQRTNSSAASRAACSNGVPHADPDEGTSHEPPQPSPWLSPSSA